MRFIASLDTRIYGLSYAQGQVVDTTGWARKQLLQYLNTGIIAPADLNPESIADVKLANLGDVSDLPATIDYVLTYDGTQWAPAPSAAAGASTLDALTDVDTTGSTDGQALAWYASEGLWKPKTITGGSASNTIISGAGAPASGTGAVGDFYYDTAAKYWYGPKDVSGWPAGFSVVGPQGIAGPANVLSIGTVTTGAAGSAASVTITGSSPSQTINLTIPRGDTGATGAASTVAGPAGTNGKTIPGGGAYTIIGPAIVAPGPFKLYNDTGAAITISAVRVACGTAPAGASLIVDVNKNGTTIFTTQANRPTVAAGSTTALSGAVSVPTWANGDYITVDIDQVGSSTAGSDIVISLVCT